MIPKDMRPNTLYSSNRFGDFIITFYKNSRSVGVYFIETKYEAVCNSYSIRNKSIVDTTFRELSQNELKRSVNYDRNTGIFTRIAGTKASKSGSILGSKNSDGYLQIMINRKRYKSHRLAWFYVTGEWPKDQIDHINHDRCDNRFSNLRNASSSINSKNMSKFKNNTSGYNGVGWNKAKKKWHSYIRIDGKLKTIGYFNNIKDAAYARIITEKTVGFHENHGA